MVNGKRAHGRRPSGDLKGLSQRMRQALQSSPAAGLTQNEISDILEVSQAVVANYLGGKSAPSLWTMVKFAELTGAPIDWLVTGKRTKLPKSLKAIWDQSSPEDKLELLSILSNQPPKISN